MNCSNQIDNLQLMELARGAMEAAYAPYTNKRVGAAVLTASGKTFTGSMVENISLSGATMCAERAAVFNAVSEGELEIAKLAIICETEQFMPPCGVCRQVFSVFLPDGEVLLGNCCGEEIRVYTTKELLPLL